MKQTTADRKPVVVFVKDLNQHHPLSVAAAGSVSSLATRRPQQHRLLDIEHDDSVGSASNTDSGNGNSSEYSGPDSDPSPPMMTSSNATIRIASAADNVSGCARGQCELLMISEESLLIAVEYKLHRFLFEK